jgi:hypothetical protein
MVKKLAIRVCPLPGCASIGQTQGSRCPTHDKLMIKETYVHQGIGPDLNSGSFDPSAADILKKMFGGK